MAGFIEITNDADGLPRAQLLGALQELAARTGLQSMDVSLSHTDEYATATVVAVRAPAAAAVAARTAVRAGRNRTARRWRREPGPRSAASQRSCGSAGTSADDELKAVRTAILVEDVVGVTLRDEEILPGLLGGAAALERLALPRERGIH